MSDHVLMPNVKNIYYNQSCNFTLEIYAYRLLSKSELLEASLVFKRQNGWSVFPHNKKYKTYLMNDQN